MNRLRVADYWLERPSSEDQPYPVQLDYPGISAGNGQTRGDASAFAVIAALFATGKPVYMSLNGDEYISTDPYFGDLALDEKKITQPLAVIDSELIWNLTRSEGRLILTLENRQRAEFIPNDGNAAIGWFFTIRNRRVMFDGETLTSPRDTGSKS